jgi:transcriptional antiterminator NusG
MAIMSKKCYVIHVFSGSEKKVSQSIEEQVISKNMQDLIEEVLVPTEEVVEIRRGSKIQSEKKFFPGYILVKMEMTDQSWHLVKSQSKVTNFLGGKGKPIAITEAEAKRLIEQISEGIERPRSSIIYEIGEEVRVSEGPFQSFNGLVEEIDEDKSRLKVAVSIFGRSTPVDLEYSQVEKI